MDMKGWLVFSVLSLLLWGLWGFLAKLATGYVGPKSVFIYAGVGVVSMGLFAVSVMGFRPEPVLKGAVLGILTGVAGTSGALFFFLAMSRGKASVVVTMTALYPLITIILSFIILREHITLKQGFGLLFALAAMLLLAT